MMKTQPVGIAVRALLIVCAGTGCKLEQEVCVVVESRTVSLEEELVEGYSAQEILDMAGPQEAELTWLLSPSGANLTNAEANAPTSISISIAAHGDEASFKRTRQSEKYEIDGNCGDTLTIPVSLRVTTADGALDETFESILSYGAERPNVVWSEATFDFESLAGWLRPDLTGVTGDLHGDVHVEFEGGERGRIGVVETYRTKNGDVGERSEEAGRWGSI